MAARKLKPVEAWDGSYAGMVLGAFDELEVQAGETPACPPNSDAPAAAPAGVSEVGPRESTTFVGPEPAAQSESCARGTTQTGTGD